MIQFIVICIKQNNVYSIERNSNKNNVL